jgi:hypothetical protein
VHRSTVAQQMHSRVAAESDCFRRQTRVRYAPGLRCHPDAQDCNHLPFGRLSRPLGSASSITANWRMGSPVQHGASWRQHHEYNDARKRPSPRWLADALAFAQNDVRQLPAGTRNRSGEVTNLPCRPRCWSIATRRPFTAFQAASTEHGKTPTAAAHYDRASGRSQAQL